MTLLSCSIPERFVNPLFEVFDGGDFILSSYRDIEEDFTRVRIFFEDAARLNEARERLAAALAIVGIAEPVFEVSEVPDEDWKFAYRRHFKTELVSPHILVQPEWEDLAVIRLDPGMAFGTGKHETTKACLQFIDELKSRPEMNAATFLDMGTGSGILSIAAAKRGYQSVRGFDVDAEAVSAACENAAKNGVTATFFQYGLGAKTKRDLGRATLVVANILGPLLIRFADEIAPCAERYLVLSGILTTLYPEVAAAYVQRGYREIGQKTIGEWTTGLFQKEEETT